MKEGLFKMDKVQKLKAALNRHGFAWVVFRLARYPLDWLKRKKFERDGLILRTAEERFNWIYKNKYWGEGETTSGSGSTLEHTANLRREIPALVEKFDIRVFLDAPCGDFAWMRHVIKDVPFEYIGADIVAPIVKDLQERYGNERIRFTHCDITTDKLPEADLMMCRDCLFHLCYIDIAAAVQNFLDSGIPYLLTTTHINNSGFRNRDIISGEHRLIDLFSPPFLFPSNPLYRIEDWVMPKPEKEMCLWSREQLLEGTVEFRKRYGVA